jgi:photosystem II stability/assembly factor-like uncharacterized protein
VTCPRREGLPVPTRRRPRTALITTALAGLLLAACVVAPGGARTGVVSPADVGQDLLLLGMSLDAAGRGVLVGGSGPAGEAHGAIRRTIDGGRTWREVTAGASGRLYGVAIDEEGVGVAVGLHGTILRTTDHGASWVRVAVEGHPWLNGVAAPKPGRFFVVGDGDAGAMSVDGGASWKDRSVALDDITPEQPPRAIAFSDAAHGWIVGEGGFAATTMDGGRTWRRVETSTDLWLRAVHFTDPLAGIIGGWQCTLWTDDGGISWRVTELPGTKVNAVLRVGTDAAIAATMDGSLLSTHDAGRTWQVVFTAPRNAHLTALRSTAEGEVIVIGDHGLVRRVAR